MGTIFFLGCPAGSTASNGQAAIELQSAEKLGKRAATFFGKPVTSVICTRDERLFGIRRAFLAGQGTTYTSVHINDVPLVIESGLNDAFHRTPEAADDPALPPNAHIRQEIVRTIDFATGSAAYAVLIVAPADLLQPILYFLHTRWRGENVAPPPLGLYGLVVVNVDAAKLDDGQENGGYVVADFNVVPSEDGTTPDHVPAAGTVAAAAI